MWGGERLGSVLEAVQGSSSHSGDSIGITFLGSIELLDTLLSPWITEPKITTD